MITASIFASLLVLPAFLFFVLLVIGYVYWTPVNMTEDDEALTAEEDKLRRSAWKAYSGLLVEGIRPDLAVKVDRILRRAETCYSIDGCQELSSSLYRQARALVASAYRHPSIDILSSHGY